MKGQMEFSRVHHVICIGKTKQCWFLVRGENWSTPEETWEPTNHNLRVVSSPESDPGHIGERRMLSPLRETAIH